MSDLTAKIQIHDPLGAARDELMPSLVAALDPVAIREELSRGLPRLAGKDGVVIVKSAAVTRYKPGKRCLIEYDVRVARPGLPRTKTKILGKVRARRFGNEGYRLLYLISHAGFRSRSQDGISVPKPLGVIPRFQMWFQRKVGGQVASEALLKPDGVALARKIAEAICKLHRANVPVERTHEMADELRILHEHLPLVSAAHPEWSNRIQRILNACDQLGASVPVPITCGIHRDFYPAQVIVDHSRLYLVDFDLFCRGNPGLDAGNFLAHVTEQSLRSHRDPSFLADREAAFEERFLQLSGVQLAPAVKAYTTLSLVRHIYLSWSFPDRQPFTPALIQLCEQRLGL